MSIHVLQPVLQERIWGGQNLKTLFGRELPPDQLIGESWELSDRPEAQSRFADSGQSLHEVWQSPQREKIFGQNAPDAERFPILIKLLDAQADLSLQVHPPAAVAAKLGGEAKTEMWYFLHTAAGAKIYVGLKRGVDRRSFEQALADKTVAHCFHVLDTAVGETMFLPSGRVHGIGAGNVILEIQQNSDTTYRVYDWDRVDAKGHPRQLHVSESLACINFNDYEPVFTQPHAERLVSCAHFTVKRHGFDEPGRKIERVLDGRSFYFLFVSRGKLHIDDREYACGSSLFVTADHGRLTLESLQESAELISVSWPE